MTSNNMATIHFAGEHIHYANTLTIYIDGMEKRSYQGGHSCSVQLTPGHHVIRIFIYNDASEDAYWIGPFEYDLKAGVEYDFTPGRS